MSECYARFTEKLWPGTHWLPTNLMVALGVEMLYELWWRMHAGISDIEEVVLPIVCFVYSLVYVRIGRPLVEKWFIEGPITRVFSWGIPMTGLSVFCWIFVLPFLKPMT